MYKIYNSRKVFAFNLMITGRINIKLRQVAVNEGATSDEIFKLS